MKRLVWLIPILIVAALLWVNSIEVDAAADSTVTLTIGQKATVKPNGCSLSVVNSTTSQVKVLCSNMSASSVPLDAVARSERQSAPLGTVTLNPGKTVKVKASQCNLQVTKNTTSIVKISCKAKPTPTPTMPINTVKVGFGGLKYSPAQITVHVGDTVHWTWSGSNHTVTSGTAPTADNLFCSPNDSNCGTANPSNAGATYDHTFNTQGTFQYFCKIHGSAMTGTVVVNP